MNSPDENLLSRRPFLQKVIFGLGALFAAALGIPAGAFLIDPRNRPAPEGAFKKAGRRDELPVGEPVQAAIRDVRQDAWTLHPDDVIGRAWLVRRENGQVDAYTTICPHLGCSINFDKGKDLFVCPCHNGTFTLDGKRLEKAGFINPSPRDMDALEVIQDSDEILVKYENFQQGTSEKVRR